MNYLVYIVRRLFLLIPLLLGVTFVVFILTRVVIAGNPIDQIVPPMASQEQRDQLAERYGLTDPIVVQYLKYMRNLVRGDMGISFQTGLPVTREILKFFPATFELTTYAMLLALLIGVPLGVVAAVWRDTWIDQLSRFLSVSGVSMPVFWFSLLLIYFFFFQWQIAPAPIGRINPRLVAPDTITGWYTIDSLITGNWKALRSAVSVLVLPTIALAYGAMAPLARMARSGMVEVLETDYIRTARAQGLRWRTVVFKYALKNALLPVVTMTAVVYGFLLGGSVLVENIFAWPGLGRFAYNAIASSDYTAIQGFVLYATTMFVVLFLITDLIYRALNPRIGP
ncbi:MAG: ABC transporter permease [Truepera sp.]|nr:ABC transporter permease [Truepera sp.]